MGNPCVSKAGQPPSTPPRGERARVAWKPSPLWEGEDWRLWRWNVGARLLPAGDVLHFLAPEDLILVDDVLQHLWGGGGMGHSQRGKEEHKQAAGVPIVELASNEDFARGLTIPKEIEFEERFCRTAHTTRRPRMERGKMKETMIFEDKFRFAWSPNLGWPTLVLGKFVHFGVKNPDLFWERANFERNPLFC